jgi:hypothetical protein
MDTENFANWLQTVFIPNAKTYAPEGYSGPIYLIVDGHKSHTSLDAWRIASDNNIKMMFAITFFTHSTAIRCSIFRSTKEVLVFST